MKITRRQLRRIIKEAEISSSRLPQNIGVMIYEKPLYKEIEICYCLLRPDGSIKAKLKLPTHAGRHQVDAWGGITINQNHEASNNTYQVAGVFANSGYGPLLYDIAMELATQKGDGLVSDRETVEDAAARVWRYYAEQRSDVEVFQGDDMLNTLTPQDDDNMNQSLTKKQAGDSWYESPLSKRYTKAPTTMAKLGDKLKRI